MIRLDEYRPYPFDIINTHLKFTLDPTQTNVEAILHIKRKQNNDNSDLLLNGEGLEIISINIDGKELSANTDYHYQNHILTIFNPADEFTLTTKVNINPKANTRLEGLYVSNDIFCTQCEAEGFRHITFYPDRPDVMSIFSVDISAPIAHYPILLSNGNLLKETIDDDGVKHVKWHDPFHKPCYLFALVGGDLELLADNFITQSGRDIDLHIYVEKGNAGRAKFAMGALQRAMKWDEDRFGLEYDLDLFQIVAISDFNMGAMENKGLNVFNAQCLLADPQSASDGDFAVIESIVAHEYFHNWTGNRITCRDWFQLSLKEGLTVFRDQEFSADMHARAVQRIDDVKMLRMRQFPEDSGPFAHPVRPSQYEKIDNFYTATIYEKGAEVIRMQHQLFGETGFMAGMDLYVQRHDGQAVTCDDFVQSMHDANDYDTTQFMRWYVQEGTPHITAKSDYNDNILTLTLHQELISEDKKPQVIPFKIAFLDAQGNKIYADNAQSDKNGEYLCILTKKLQIFTFDIKDFYLCEYLCDFSAPIILHSDYSDDDLVFLSQYAKNQFVQWEALQIYAKRAILNSIAHYQKTQNMQFDDGLLNAYQYLWNTARHDDAFQSLCYILPDYSEICETSDIIYPHIIDKVIEAYYREIATQNIAIINQKYHDCGNNGEYIFNATEAGRRKLRNICLRFMLVADNEKYAPLALTHYRESNNFNDQFAALSLLNRYDCQQRDSALADYYDRFHDDEITLDKWFSLQSSAPFAGGLNRLEKLLQHKKFSLKKPNQVRAVIGGFAVRNLTNFHHQESYEKIGDILCDIDALNPMMAARLLSIFSQWRKFEPHLSQAMCDVLKRLQNSNLSDNASEIVNKTLQ